VIRVAKSPYSEDYEDDNPPPWDYAEEGFVRWVDEVFLEGFKDIDPEIDLSVEEAIEILELEGYEVVRL